MKSIMFLYKMNKDATPLNNMWHKVSKREHLNTAHDVITTDEECEVFVQEMDKEQYEFLSRIKTLRRFKR